MLKIMSMRFRNTLFFIIIHFQRLTDYKNMIVKLLKSKCTKDFRVGT